MLPFTSHPRLASLAKMWKREASKRTLLASKWLMSIPYLSLRIVSVWIVSTVPTSFCGLVCTGAGVGLATGWPWAGAAGWLSLVTGWLLPAMFTALLAGTSTGVTSAELSGWLLTGVLLATGLALTVLLLTSMWLAEALGSVVTAATGWFWSVVSALTIPT